AGDGAQLGQGPERLGGPARLAEAFGRQGDAVLVTGGVNLCAIGDRVSTPLLGGRGRPGGGGVERHVARPRGQRDGAGEFEDGAANVHRTGFALFLRRFGRHEAEEVVVDECSPVPLFPALESPVLPDVVAVALVPPPVGAVFLSPGEASAEAEA